jgi:hypothetical protein
MKEAERILSKITKLLDEYRELTSSNTAIIDEFGVLYMIINNNTNEVELSIIAEEQDFKNLIYNMLTANKDYANNVMEVVEDFKRKTFN